VFGFSYLGRLTTKNYAMENPITVSARLAVPVEKAWQCWTDPEHITRWNAASPDWHTPSASLDLRPGGVFSFRMEARDGSMGFDFAGTVDEVRPMELIQYTIGDGRTWAVLFKPVDGATEVTEQFEAESENSRELQQQGWQSILDSFKRHTEARSREKQLRFVTFIEATPEKVHRILVHPDTYRQWTAEFNPTSRYEGNWKEGESIRFVGDGPDGKQGGIIGRIRKEIPGEFLSLEQYGLIKAGVDIFEGPEVEPWAGAQENYYFTPEENGTRLTVTLETNADFESYFQSTWPKALAKLKSICEA
jgi:uncharacterized protein YndB with AHSA1/START domain